MMMKMKILKTELIFQILVLLACFIWFLVTGIHDNYFYILFYIFPILAAANFLGFFVRIFTVRSKWMAYYFMAVIIYLPILFLLWGMYESSYFFISKIYFYAGSVLISLYYTVSGFFIIQDQRINLKKK